MEYIGGQALIEGVMILSREKIGIALARKKKIMTIRWERLHLGKRFEKTLFLRGIFSLLEMLYLGTKALMLSAEYATGSDGEEKKAFGFWEILFALVLPLILALGIFVGAPFFLASLVFERGVLFNVTEGVIRVILFFGYLYGISFMKDVGRIFQYHGAEHMAVHCYESGSRLTPDHVALFPKEHPRCGTTFLVFVLVIAIFVFSLVTSSSIFIQILSRIVLIPVIAGISYELLKLSARFHSHWGMKTIMLPGLWVQRITTAIPEDGQIKVAIAAVNACLQSSSQKKKTEGN